MKFKQLLGHRFAWIFVVSIPTIVCLIFPTNNSTQDGWCYAADAHWVQDLFMPHHLLYTAQLYFFSKLFPFVEIILLGKCINALFVGATLLVLNKSLNFIENNNSKVNALTFFVGSTFAVLRFGTENETYIIPIFYSLVGNLYFFKFNKHQNLFYLFLAGLFLSVACLFHQIQFFWWLGIFIYLAFSFGSKYWQALFIYIISALLVPLLYLLVFVYYKQTPLGVENFIHFVFETFYTGTSSFAFNLQVFLRFFSAVIRCFLQIHSNVLTVIFAYQWVVVIAILLLVTILYFLFWFVKSVKWINTNYKNYFTFYIGLLLAYFLFGFLYHGNSEMMVMIPFLISFLMILKVDFHQQTLFLLSFCLFVWNLLFGLVVNNQLKFNTNEKWAKKAINDPKSIYILRYATEINSYCYYENGKYPKNILLPNCKDYIVTKFKIDSLIDEGYSVYSDCVEKGIIRNSTSIGCDDTYSQLLGNYNTTIVDSAQILNKVERLYKLQKNDR